MSIKKFLKLTFFVVTVVILGYLINDNYYLITNKIEYIYKKYLQPDIKQTLIDNDYRKKENYTYVKINTDTNIKNKDDLKNAIYTFLDAGWDSYTIRCDADYLNCTNEVKDFVANKTELTNISNFVHPFNTFENFNTQISSSGKITFTIEKKYNENQIKEINEKIETIYNEIYDSSKNIQENIKIFHDYIINNTKYDSNNKSGLNDVNSSTSYGVLFEKVGICSGYADTMSLFLEKLNVKNYRVSSETHIWNLVYVEGKWKHLDLTWDDPVTSDNTDVLNHDYFLIDYEKLVSNPDNEHNFDENIYIEAK